MWRVIDIRIQKYLMDLDLICRRAVDLSQGQLIDLHMEDCGDETLIYVCNRSSHLRRLSLVSGNYGVISGKALTEAVKKLPMLEELHLIYMQRVLPRHVKSIGNSCPSLKSFTFNLRGRRPPLYESEDDEFPHESEDEGDFDVSGLRCKYALVIAKSMPNLRHLQLFANYLRNDGLQALLDGCPHLESLDLRQCHRLDLSGALGDRCLQQIKSLRLPCDSVNGYEWDTGSSPYKRYTGTYDFEDYYDFDDYSFPYFFDRYW